VSEYSLDSPSTHYVISETSLSSESLALVLTTKQEQSRDRIHK